MCMLFVTIRSIHFRAKTHITQISSGQVVSYTRKLLFFLLLLCIRSFLDPRNGVSLPFCPDFNYSLQLMQIVFFPCSNLSLSGTSATYWLGNAYLNSFGGGTFGHNRVLQAANSEAQSPALQTFLLASVPSFAFENNVALSFSKGRMQSPLLPPTKEGRVASPTTSGPKALASQIFWCFLQEAELPPSRRRSTILLSNAFPAPQPASVSSAIPVH